MPPEPPSPEARGLPPVFLRYQQELMASVAAEAVTVVEKSRRTGYSWTAAAIAALTAAAARGQGGMDVFYMGYEKEMTREFVSYVGDWAREFQLAASAMEEVVFPNPDRPDQDIGAFRIRFASGFEVVALPSVARALRGKQGLVILDEAAFVDDLEAVLNAAFALTIWGGKVLVISTHFGEANPFNELVVDVRAGRKPYRLLRCTLDDALADGLYRRICLTSGKPWSPEAEAAWRDGLLKRYGPGAEQELFVVPSPVSGTWLPLPVIEKCTDPSIPVLRWAAPAGFATWREDLRAAEVRDWLEAELRPLLAKLDANTPHALGQDFARKGDLSVLWPVAIGRDLVRRPPFVVELRDMPFSQQRQVLFHLCDRLPRLRAVALDATGNGMAHAEAAADRYGARAIQVAMTEAWYRENMPPMKAAFEDATTVLPRDRDVVADHRLVKLVRGVPRVVERSRGADEGAGGGQRHGDSAVAHALALLASKAEPEEYAYEAVRPARGRARDARAEELEDEMGGGRLR